MSPIAITALVVFVTGLTLAFVGGLLMWTSLAEAARQVRKANDTPHPLDRPALALDPVGIVGAFFVLVYLVSLLQYWTWKDHGQSTLTCFIGIGAMLVSAVIALAF